jgi:diaminohydroxyphosphoribosylaminopyrimidine deaminase/5-amino-6-(5-phosphoribosylamino)uracil reductase
MLSVNDEAFMRRAIELAEKGRFSVSPNPMVGCVIVRDGEVLGEGFHERAGEPHAEVMALRAAGDARGATAYVTLEPCAHFGRTPPCVEALIGSGIARVVVAASDPFEEVNGKGIERLRTEGIEVEVGVVQEEAERLNEKFLYSAKHRRPFLLLKAGMTLDGKLATIERQSKWITSADARDRSLRLREEYDAILVGGGTVLHDDPQLTRRLGLNSSIQPWARIVVDARGDLPLSSRLFTDGGRTLLFTSDPENYGSLPSNVEVAGARPIEGALDLTAILEGLHALGIRSLLAEGGSMLHSHLIRERLWQKMTLFVAPMIVGGPAAPSIFSDRGVAELTDAYRLRFDAVEQVGSDLMITAYPA